MLHTRRRASNAAMTELRTNLARGNQLLDELLAEQRHQRLVVRRRSGMTAIIGTLIAVTAGAGSSWLLMPTLAPTPLAGDPGVIAVSLAGNSDAVTPVDVRARFNTSNGPATNFQIVVNSTPVDDTSISAVLIFCGAIRDGLQLDQANTDRPVPLTGLPDPDDTFDSQLGNRSDCSSVSVSSNSAQIIMTGRSNTPLTSVAGSKILYALPMVTTVIDEDISGLPMKPLASGSTIYVSLDNIRADLEITTAAPQIPESGNLAWAYPSEMGDDAPHPSVWHSRRRGA